MNTLFCFSVSVFLMSSFKCQLLDVGMYSRSAAGRVRIEQCAAHAKCWQKNMRERDRNTVTYRELKKQAARNYSVEWEVLESSKESFLFDADLLSHLCCFPETLFFISATLTAASQHLFPYIDPHRGHTHFEKHIWRPTGLALFYSAYTSQTCLIEAIFCSVCGSQVMGERFCFLMDQLGILRMLE